MERLYYYSVLQYVPRPRRGERVNFGVVVVRDDGDEVATEFTRDWHRARVLGNASDIPFLQKLAREWKREFRSASELGRLFQQQELGSEWLERLHEQAANVVQLAEPLRAVAESATDLARELFEELVSIRVAAQRAASPTRRGLQVAFESQLRHRGLGAAWERDFVAAGAEVRDWTFDYAIKNGQPFHFVHTLSLLLRDTKEILSEASYVATAQRDLRGSETFASVPVSVIAVPPAEDSIVITEVESILAHERVPLFLRDSVPELVDRLATVAGVPHLSEAS